MEAAKEQEKIRRERECVSVVLIDNAPEPKRGTRKYEREQKLPRPFFPHSISLRSIPPLEDTTKSSTFRVIPWIFLFVIIGAKDLLIFVERLRNRSLDVVPIEKPKKRRQVRGKIAYRNIDKLSFFLINDERRDGVREWFGGDGEGSFILICVCVCAHMNIV